MALKKTIQTKSKIKAKRLGDLVTDSLLDGFDNKTRIVGLTNGSFSLISLIHSILKKTGPADVTISTWSAGWYDVQVVKDLINSGLVKKFRLVIDRSFKTRQKEYAIGVEQIFKPEDIRTTNTHSKFVLIKNNDYSVCVLSSMNLNENKRSENFDINTDEDVYNLFSDFTEDLFKIQPSGLIDSRKIVDSNFDAIFGVEHKERSTPLNHSFNKSAWE